MWGGGGRRQTQADMAWPPAPPACCFNDIETSGNPRPLEGLKGPTVAEAAGWAGGHTGGVSSGKQATPRDCRWLTNWVLTSATQGPPRKDGTGCGASGAFTMLPADPRQRGQVQDTDISVYASVNHPHIHLRTEFTAQTAVHTCELPTCTAKERVQDTDCCARVCELPCIHPEGELLGGCVAQPREEQVTETTKETL